MSKLRYIPQQPKGDSVAISALLGAAAGGCAGLVAFGMTGAVDNTISPVMSIAVTASLTIAVGAIMAWFTHVTNEGNQFTFVPTKFYSYRVLRILPNGKEETHVNSFAGSDLKATHDWLDTIEAEPHIALYIFASMIRSNGARAQEFRMLKNGAGTDHPVNDEFLLAVKR